MKLFSVNSHLHILDMMSNSSIQSWYNFCLESKRYTPNQIEQYQERNLRKIINHALKNTQYYRNELVDSHLDESDDVFKVLSKFQILSKIDIRNNFERIVANNRDDFPHLSRRTGGTTGIPLSYLYDKQSWSLGWALKLRDWDYGGYRIGDKMALLAGASIVPNQKRNIKRSIWNELNGFIPMSTTHFDKNILRNYLKILKSQKVKFLRGYPSSLLGLAEYVRANNLDLEIRAIFSTAEVLLTDHRDYIEDVFKCKVFDQYGAADACAHGSECDHHNGFHVSFEPSYCEIVNIEEIEKGTKIGELVYTSFTNFSMPMIRYAPGDLAEIQESYCTCGRKTKMIKRIIGRSTERIIFPNGRALAGPAFTLVFRKFDLMNYQLVQNSVDSLDINLVVDKKFNMSQEKEIYRIMRFQCGEGVDIRINYLKELPKLRSGKNSFIVSNI